MLNQIKTITFILTLFLLSVSGHAQTLVTGIVRDTRFLPVSGAKIKIKPDSVAAITDSLGKFSFKASLKGKEMLRLEAFGFLPDSIQIDSSKTVINVSFFLKDSQPQLKAVQIVSRLRFNNVNLDIAQSSITTAMAAGAAADVAAALQIYPGAAPTGNETGFFVRGGSAAETAVVFDGLMVKNAFGSKLPDLANRSRFSTFLFEKTTFTTDGFSAGYGQALSSVLSMDTKDLALKSSTEFALVNLGIGAARTERFKNSSLTVGANYYNFDLYHAAIKQNTLWQMDPLQYQTSLSYKLKTAEYGMLKVFVDYSDTDLSFDLINPNTMGRDLLKNNNKNLYLNTNYQGRINEYWKIYAGIGYNNTKEKGEIAGNIYDQTDQIWQQKLMLTKLFSPALSMRFGAEYFQSERREGYNNRSRAYQDRLAAMFAETDLSVFDQLEFSAGLRSEHSRHIRKWNWSPRIATKYFPRDNQHVKLSYGIYYQKPDDSFLAETAELGFESNQQFALDYELKMRSGLLKLAAYHKKYEQLTEITTPVFSGFQAYGPPLQVMGFDQKGFGIAKGLELFYKNKTYIRNIEFSVSYSYLDTERKYLDYPDFGRPAFAPEHTANIALLGFNKKVNYFLSAVYTYSSGRTYFNPSNPVFMGDQAKDYHNLSLSLTYLPRLWKSFSSINLNVNNVLGLKNVYGYRYAYNGGQRTAVLPPANRSALISFLMNIDGDDFNH